MSTRDLADSPADPADVADLADVRIAAAIDRHVAATSAALSQQLAATLPALAEPRAADPTHALRLLGYLVETLLGVATGSVVGQVVSSVLRGLGSDVGFALELRLREALRRIGPRSDARVDVADLARARSPFVIDAATRPLVDELGACLYPRLARAGHDHGTVLTRLSTAVPAARMATFLSTLELVERDRLLSSLWSEHLQIAWRFYTAAVSGASEPALPSDLATSAASETWRAWLRRVRPDLPPVPPVASAVADGEYIMAVG